MKRQPNVSQNVSHETFVQQEIQLSADMTDMADMADIKKQQILAILTKKSREIFTQSNGKAIACVIVTPLIVGGVRGASPRGNRMIIEVKAGVRASNKAPRAIVLDKIIKVSSTSSTHDDREP